MTVVAVPPAWLTATSMPLASITMPSGRPTTLTPVAVACSDVQVRAVVAGSASGASLASARPNSTPDRRRPISSPVPPFTPAKAFSPAPPMLSRSTSTSSPVAAPPVGASVTVVDSLRTARSPLNSTNPFTDSVSRPLASTYSPSVPAMSMATVPALPVDTDSEVAPAV